MSMMLHMILTWIVMIGLVGVFIYLCRSARRATLQFRKAKRAAGHMGLYSRFVSSVSEPTFADRDKPAQGKSFHSLGRTHHEEVNYGSHFSDYA